MHFQISVNFYICDTNLFSLALTSSTFKIYIYEIFVMLSHGGSVIQNVFAIISH